MARLLMKTAKFNSSRGEAIISILYDSITFEIDGISCNNTSTKPVFAVISKEGEKDIEEEFSPSSTRVATVSTVGMAREKTRDGGGDSFRTLPIGFTHRFYT